MKVHAGRQAAAEMLETQMFLTLDEQVFQRANALFPTLLLAAQRRKACHGGCPSAAAWSEASGMSGDQLSLPEVGYTTVTVAVGTAQARGFMSRPSRVQLISGKVVWKVSPQVKAAPLSFKASV